MKYPLATNFNIVSPRLDNYSYTLFSIYSKVEKDYPLSIECNYLEGNTSKTDTTYNYDCNNEEEFIELKTDSLKDRAKKISNKALSNVMDLKIENKDEIEYRLKQLQALLNVSNIKTDSLFLNKVKKGEFDGLEELLFSGELINLENEKIEDPFINSYIKSIIDIFIFT